MQYKSIWKDDVIHINITEWYDDKDNVCNHVNEQEWRRCQGFTGMQEPT